MRIRPDRLPEARDWVAHQASKGGSSRRRRVGLGRAINYLLPVGSRPVWCVSVLVSDIGADMSSPLQKSPWVADLEAACRSGQVRRPR